MSKIFNQSPLYSITKFYAVWSFRQYYDEVIVVGSENIPENKPVIFAPNHLNALMDALAILSLAPFGQTKVYLSRADLFNRSRLISKLLRFAKLMPAFRIRDGYGNLGRNKSSFETAEAVLLHHAALCIMPEGDQGTERRIRPLVKGIFRIAFNTLQKLPKDETLYIVPVGIDLGDLIKFGKHLIINIGKPIDISEYAEEYTENPAVALNKIKQRLQEALENLALHLGSDRYYACFETAIEASNTDMAFKMKLKNNTLNRFWARKQLEKILRQLEKEDPKLLNELDTVCKKYKSGMQKVKASHKMLELPIPSGKTILFGIVSMVFLFLLSLPGIILNIVPLVLVLQAPKILKIEFKGFYSSVYYAAGAICFPLFYILQSLILISVFTLPGWMFWGLIPLHYVAGKLSLRLSKIIQTSLLRLRLYFSFQKHRETMESLRLLKRKIAETLINRAF